MMMKSKKDAGHKASPLTRAMGTIPKKSDIDVKRCLRAERMMYEAIFLFDNGANPRVSSDFTNKSALSNIVDNLYREDVQENAPRQIAQHLQVGQLTRRLMTRPEFEAAFNQHPNMELAWKEHLWEHLTHCIVFFVNTYQEIVDAIESLEKEGKNQEFVLKRASWISNLVQLIKDSWQVISFCAGCEWNERTQCEFWRGVASRIATILSNPEKEAKVTAIQKYLSELELACKCPRSVEELEALDRKKTGKI